LVVFDLDGTLVDSRRDIADAANALLVECGANALPEDAVGRMVGDGAATLVARAFAASSLVLPADALARFIAIYDRRLLDSTRPYAGMVEVLTALASRVTLAVLTNKPLGATRRILEGLGLARFFDPALVCGGDGPHPRKPDPAGLLHLIRSTEASPAATLMVGDSVIDWRTAHAASSRVCLARYGFGFEGFPVAELHADDRLIDAPSALLGVVGI
jgi:phosphoglycolate phosphatase